MDEIMKRDHQTDIPYLINDPELTRQTAFHEAGHAAAIYLYNKQKQLPPVHFQIAIKAIDSQKDNHLAINGNFSAVLEGGFLIHSLPLALIESAHYLSVTEHAVYQTAFEADMINLLIGPLAEAKYVAIHDNEPFDAHLINIDALYNYGGTSNLNKIHEYLDIFIVDKNRHQEKLAQLFDKAFQFINSTIHWQAIERLAHYILNNREDIISCEEAIIVLDKA
jgi:hypothetical protein